MLAALACAGRPDRPSKCIVDCVNGKCVKNACVCAPNWRGAACDSIAASNQTVDIKECAPKCINGGTCVNGACACPPNWSGAACELPCAKWRPRPGTSWQIILSGDFSDSSAPAELYDIDLFNTKQAAIDKLHAMGRKVICYFSAGSIENGRPDTSRFTSNLRSSPMDGWPEDWIDISKLNTDPLLKDIMTARLDLAVKKKCDGVDPDNMDAYANGVKRVGGGAITYKDQLDYNRWIAQTAHARGLIVGLKNDLEQIPDLLNYFDFAVNEECFEFKECDSLIPFINANKAVFNIEYNVPVSKYCDNANRMKIDSLFKTRDVKPKPFTQCRQYTGGADYQCAPTFMSRAFSLGETIENSENETAAASSTADAAPPIVTVRQFDAKECVNNAYCIAIVSGTILVCVLGIAAFIYVMFRYFYTGYKLRNHNNVDAITKPLEIKIAPTAEVNAA